MSREEMRGVLELVGGEGEEGGLGREGGEESVER